MADADAAAGEARDRVRLVPDVDGTITPSQLLVAATIMLDHPNVHYAVVSDDPHERSAFVVRPGDDDEDAISAEDTANYVGADNVPAVTTLAHFATFTVKCESVAPIGNASCAMAGAAFLLCAHAAREAGAAAPAERVAATARRVDVGGGCTVAVLETWDATTARNARGAAVRLTRDDASVVGIAMPTRDAGSRALVCYSGTNDGSRTVYQNGLDELVAAVARATFAAAPASYVAGSVGGAARRWVQPHAAVDARGGDD